jgi:hypothetical protein
LRHSNEVNTAVGVGGKDKREAGSEMVRDEKVGRCRLPVSKPVLKARLVSAISA